MAASSDIPLQIAETVQTAHIRRHPSPTHDINPPTAADRREPVRLDELDELDDVVSELDDTEAEGDEDDAVPYSVIRPRRRSAQLPPLPDLRFEQSYLHSIANADTWWKVALITIRDQMMMPLMQGVLYNLAVCGWQHWNKNARIHGNSVGAKMRRWWYGVNKWAIPPEKRRAF